MPVKSPSMRRAFVTSREVASVERSPAAGTCASPSAASWRVSTVAPGWAATQLSRRPTV
ncbi:MAG: hypothetical protein QM704_20660 [Anaeromyxobacteraceae bacterium]